LEFNVKKAHLTAKISGGTVPVRLQRPQLRRRRFGRVASRVDGIVPLVNAVYGDVKPLTYSSRRLVALPRCATKDENVDHANRFVDRLSSSNVELRCGAGKTPLKELSPRWRFLICGKPARCALVMDPLKLLAMRFIVNNDGKLSTGTVESNSVR
jgi:hypothetical protein